MKLGDKVDESAIQRDAKDSAPSRASADGIVKPARDIPETRRHDLAGLGGEPPQRGSSLDMMAAVMTYPDDGTLSGALRKADGFIGRIEQILLVMLLASVVLVGAGHALLEKLFHHPISFKDDVIRGGTFGMAMLGGAFAAHQAKHLSMDLVSRRLSPRARLFLSVVLSLFTIFVCVLLIRAGMHTIRAEATLAGTEDKLITPARIAWLIPIGASLIIVHNVLHAVIDIDYIARRKTPPERMRSGH